MTLYGASQLAVGAASEPLREATADEESEPEIKDLLEVGSDCVVAHVALGLYTLQIAPRPRHGTEHSNCQSISSVRGRESLSEA